MSYKYIVQVHCNVRQYIAHYYDNSYYCFYCCNYLDEKAAKRKVDEESVEGKKLAVMMMPRKKRKLYDKIMYGKKKKAAEVCLFLLIYDFMLIYFRPYLVLVHMCDTKLKQAKKSLSILHILGQRVAPISASCLAEHTAEHKVLCWS